MRERAPALGCEILGACAESRDDGASRIERAGQSWFRVTPTLKTIMTSLGPVTYRRARYRTGASSASLMPVDASLGLVNDYLTRPAAQLGLMMGHCTCGHLQTNPARGIKRNPGPKLNRFLSREEVRRFHRELDRHAGDRASRAGHADIIRFLLRIGCRKSEIRTLRWQDVNGDTLNLTEAKTGPRRVFLNAQARRSGAAAATRLHLHLPFAEKSGTTAFAQLGALAFGAKGGRD